MNMVVHAKVLIAVYILCTRMYPVFTIPNLLPDANH